MKLIVEQKGYSGFRLNKNGKCYFKKVKNELTSAKIKHNKNAHGIWIYEWKAPDEIAEIEEDGWTRIPCHNLLEGGDVHVI